jgi:hypothetical protein
VRWDDNVCASYTPWFDESANEMIGYAGSSINACATYSIDHNKEFVLNCGEPYAWTLVCQFDS